MGTGSGNGNAGRTLGHAKNIWIRAEVGAIELTRTQILRSDTLQSLKSNLRLYFDAAAAACRVRGDGRWGDERRTLSPSTCY
jgi:hypothetical protein